MLRSFSLIAILLCFFHRSAKGQWELVHDFGLDNSTFVDIEFLHQFGKPHIGFAITSVCDDRTVWRTSDAGASWEPISVPDPYASSGFPQNLTFVDDSTGFLSWILGSNDRPILKTTDAGLTWSTSYPGKDVNTLYYICSNPWTKAVFAPGSKGLLRTTNLGSSWSSVSSTIPRNIVFTNANDGIGLFPRNGYAVTSDGGATWSSLKPFASAYRIFGARDTRMFFLVTTDFESGLFHGIAKTLHVSTDVGETWEERTVPPGWYGDESFVWTGTGILTQGPLGVYHSADTGRTWQSLCGPVSTQKVPYLVDYFQVPFAYNDTVYCHDHDGRLWVNSSLSSGETAPVKPQWQGPWQISGNGYEQGTWCNAHVTYQCGRSTYLRIIDRNSCDPTVVTSIELLKSNGFSNLQLPDLPLTIDTAGYIWFDFTDTNNDVDSAHFRIKFTINGQAFDTTILYTGIQAQLPQYVLSTDTVIVHAKTACERFDTTITMRVALPCDSMIIEKAWLDDSTVFHIVSSDLPAVVQNSDTVHVRVTGESTASGEFTTRLRVRLRFQKSIIDTSVLIRYIVPSGASPSVHAYTGQEQRSCSVVDTALVIRNPTCDTITLKSLNITDRSIFDYDTLALPVTILPGETIVLPFSFSRDTTGTFQSKVSLSINWNGGQLSPTVSNTVTIKESGLLAIQDSATIHDACDPIVRLTVINQSCDTIRIVSASIQSGPATILASYPIPIDPLETEYLRLNITRKEIGSAAIQLSIRYVVNGTSFDTSITVNVEVLQAPQLLPTPEHTQLSFESVSTCSKKELTTKLTNMGCEEIRLSSLQITPPGDFTIVSPITLPVDIPADSSIDIVIEFAPQALGLSNAVLSAICANPREMTTLSIALDGIGITGGSAVLRLDSSRLNLGAISVCDVDSVLLSLGNNGCDSLEIEPLTTSGNTAFSIEAQLSSYTIGPSDELRVWVRFAPQTLGPLAAVLRIRSKGTSQTDWIEDSITLSGEGLFPIHPLLVDIPAFKTIPSCSVDSVIVPITNRSCNPQQVVIGVLDGDFSIDISPFVLAPGETRNYSLYFTPTHAGDHIGALMLRSIDTRFNTTIFDTTITLDGTALASESLTASLNGIDFGITNICEVKDTVLTLRNTGCDTIVILQADIDRFFVVDTTLPIVIAAGQSIDLPIVTVMDTTGKPTTSSGLLRIKSTADNALAPIVLTRELIYPATLRIEAVDEASGKLGETVKFRIVLDGDVPEAMTALHFHFIHNNDLLSFTELDGADLRITSTIGQAEQRQSFTLSPVRAGVLGEVSFKVFLSAADQTSLTFDNIRLESSLSGPLAMDPECIASILDSGSRFEYIYSCGERIASGFMRNGSMLITSIAPNPARNEIQVRLADHVLGAEIVISNIMGSEVLRTTSDRNIDVSTLPAGTYYLRVMANGQTQTKRIVIER